LVLGVFQGVLVTTPAAKEERPLSRELKTVHLYKMLSAIERKTTRLLVDYRGSHWKRRTRINPPATLLGQRWFSQNKDSENIDDDQRKTRKFSKQSDPLLRAFETKNVSKKTVSTPSQYQLDKTQRNRPKNDKNTSIRTARTNTVSSSTEKKASLADFFADLGANSKASPPTTKDGAGHARTPRGNVFSGDRPPSNQYNKDSGDVGSFFDKVDAIMKRNEELKTSLSSSNGEISSTHHERILSTSLQSASSSPTLANGGRRSILDMFPPNKPRSPNAYDEEMFEQYSVVMEHVMSMPKFLRRHTRKSVAGPRAQAIVDWLQSDEPSIPCQLPLLEKALTKEGLSQEETLHATELFRIEMSAQREAFLRHHGWDKGQYTNAGVALANIGALCAKTANAKPIDIAWKKLKEGGFPMKFDMLHNYLYVTATFSTRSATRLLASLHSGGVGSSILEFLSGPVGSSGGARAESSRAKGIVANAPLEVEDGVMPFEDLPSEMAICHDIQYKPSEQTLMIRVRMLVLQGKARMAEQLLDNNSVRSSDGCSFSCVCMLQCCSGKCSVVAAMGPGDNDVTRHHNV
jgi:hypothetical protein